MSKNRKVRNAKVIRKLLSANIPFDTRFMVPGHVYQYHNDWLFCLRANGTLGTDLGNGMQTLRRDHTLFNDNHDHWCIAGRVIKKLLGVTLPV